jgi:hypothetical protein
MIRFIPYRVVAFSENEKLPSAESLAILPTNPWKEVHTVNFEFGVSIGVDFGPPVTRIYISD